MKKYVNRQHVSLALALFVLYLAIVFWPHFAKWCTTIFAAMTPLLIGAVIAYIVNLLLRKYEQLYRRLFKGPRAKKFQRLWGIFLSYLSIFLILAIVIRQVITNQPPAQFRHCHNVTVIKTEIPTHNRQHPAGTVIRCH